jgi:hypothetical protein
MGHSEADAAWARCNADRVRGSDPMQVDGGTGAPQNAARGIARQEIGAPVEDYQAQRQAARASDGGSSVQQGFLDEIRRQRTA